ncbi:Zn-ribbon domain-containing OB-fold protein [Vineibacter terrae]|uniref:ChsH2 C-terminal OB-fold domain-containing protein n=1 Tax=Vineibacter terrae TaxID=2586908 RepID=A0A5C8PDF4_9HYPH|nr:OB-fold domain-containing protein [Vineibacter terrae]TXL71628.1 hypothetical protein FHP25_29255 [Vineibacter terrae]HEX2892332.1 OB-fold domain-containing protein [Vineibacter terrae]
MGDVSGGVPPIVPFLHRDGAKPYLGGSRCEACGHVFVGERSVCAKCAARDKMKAVRLAETGKLYVYTVVKRSFPGVAVPFVDAIVDLDDGSHLKGTLEGVEPDPDHIKFNMRVKVAYREAQPVNSGGKPYLTYYFVPA